jgi:ribA/ribD-fused uncharacterized protein
VENCVKQGLQIYQRSRCTVFLKTHDAFGGLSNMASGYPVTINDIPILTSEALYQACRFPLRPEIQRKIIEQASPMAAKMVGKPYRKSNTRTDWEEVNLDIMNWCLRVKLAQNWMKFAKLLLDTKHTDIVEESKRDAFWGAKPIDENTLVGFNHLGGLLMGLREQLQNPGRESLLVVDPLQIDDFLLFGESIRHVACRSDWSPDTYSPSGEMQLGLF